MPTLYLEKLFFVEWLSIYVKLIVLTVDRQKPK